MCLKLTFKVRQNLNTDLDIRNILRGPDIGGQFGPRKSVFAVHLQHSTRGDSDKFLSEFVHFVLAKITCLFLITGVYLSGTQDNKDKSHKNFMTMTFKFIRDRMYFHMEIMII